MRTDTVMLSRFLSRIYTPRIRPWWLVGAIFVLFLLAGCSRPADDPQLARQIELGGRVYAANCVACHGPEGEGQPDWKTPKEDGTYPAPPHDTSGHTWHHGDGTLLQIIRGGGDSLDVPNFKSVMPAFEDTLNDEEIVAVLAYLKSRWPEEEQQFQAEMTQKDPAPSKKQDLFLPVFAPDTRRQLLKSTIDRGLGGLSEKIREDQPDPLNPLSTKFHTKTITSNESELKFTYHHPAHC